MAVHHDTATREPAGAGESRCEVCVADADEPAVAPVVLTAGAAVEDDEHAGSACAAVPASAEATVRVSATVPATTARVAAPTTKLFRVNRARRRRVGDIGHLPVGMRPAGAEVVERGRGLG